MERELDQQELFRLASLIGCEPQSEERHRADLLAYIAAHTEAAVRKARIGELARNNDRIWKLKDLGPYDFVNAVIKANDERYAALTTTDKETK